MAVVVTVAVPVPALPGLSYRVPDGMATPPVGGRVRVPLGPRVVTGCVLDAPDADAGGATGSPVPPAELKDLLESLDPEPYLPREVLGPCALGGRVLRVRTGGVAGRRDAAVGVDGVRAG